MPIARCLCINGNAADAGTPFGGYRQSGNGREGGVWGLEEYLEVKKEQRVKPGADQTRPLDSAQTLYSGPQ